jgi:hypothetical protein
VYYDRRAPPKVSAGNGSGGAVYTPRAVDCFSCKASDLDQHLHKCPICFKWACDNCATHAFGRHFCSKKCSDEFFYGDDDDD